jgi:hypothetical protein
MQHPRNLEYTRLNDTATICRDIWIQEYESVDTRKQFPIISPQKKDGAIQRHALLQGNTTEDAGTLQPNATTVRSRKTATLHPKINVTKRNGELERNTSSYSESLRTPNLRSILQSTIGILTGVINSTELQASPSIQQSVCPSTSRSTNNGIPCGLCNRKIIQRFKNSPPLVRILSQLKPLRIFQPCF